MLSALCFDLDQAKILSSGYGLIQNHHRNSKSGINFLALIISNPRKKNRRTLESNQRHSGFKLGT